MLQELLPYYEPLHGSYCKKGFTNCYGTTLYMGTPNKALLNKSTYTCNIGNRTYTPVDNIVKDESYTP